jgi:hypothetical protein
MDAVVSAQALGDTFAVLAISSVPTLFIGNDGPQRQELDPETCGIGLIDVG